MVLNFSCDLAGVASALPYFRKRTIGVGHATAALMFRRRRKRLLSPPEENTQAIGRWHKRNTIDTMSLAAGCHSENANGWLLRCEIEKGAAAAIITPPGVSV
jgi:hypothetical protein